MPRRARATAREEKEEHELLWQGAARVVEALRENQFDEWIEHAEAAEKTHDTKQLVACCTAGIKADSAILDEIDQLLLSVIDSVPLIHFERGVQVADQVAAKVASHDLWILGQVLALRPNNLVDIQDLDDELRQHAVHLTDLILLPRTPKELQEAHHLFQPPCTVFAMYPNTTSFYKAQVVSPPHPPPSDHDYHDTASRTDGTSSFGDFILVVRFADDENDAGLLPNRSIPLRFVTNLPSSLR